MVKQLHSPLIPWSTGHLSPPPARTGANAVTVAAEKCKYLESLVGACRLGCPGWWEAGRVTVLQWLPWRYGAQTAVFTTLTLNTRPGSYKEM